MTRNEAVRLYRNVVIGNGIGGVIDFMIKAGILKVEEEKTEEDKIEEKLKKIFTFGCPDWIVNALDSVGLKIVEK